MSIWDHKYTPGEKKFNWIMGIVLVIMVCNLIHAISEGKEKSSYSSSTYSTKKHTYSYASPTKASAKPTTSKKPSSSGTSYKYYNDYDVDDYDNSDDFADDHFDDFDDWWEAYEYWEDEN